jgi:DNA-3-methyladenine glycosylase
MKKVLDKQFFNRKTLIVAQDLLGKYLVRKIGRKIRRYKITEVESYVGSHDLASHSSKGRTERNEVMFGEAGRFYIYLVYGMYYMLNVVTEEKDSPSAILIRGLESISGPGRITKTLGIGKKLNGKLASPKSRLWFEGGEKNSARKIKRAPRIGVNYAGPLWSKKPYRFILEE